MTRLAGLTESMFSHNIKLNWTFCCFTLCPVRQTFTNLTGSGLKWIRIDHCCRHLQPYFLIFFNFLYFFVQCVKMISFTLLYWYFVFRHFPRFLVAKNSVNSGKQYMSTIKEIIFTSNMYQKIQIFIFTSFCRSVVRAN